MHMFMLWIWIWILLRLRRHRRGRPAHPLPEADCNEPILLDTALHHTRLSTQVGKGVATAAAAAPQADDHHLATARLELGTREEEPHVPYREQHPLLLPSVLHDDSRPALIVRLGYDEVILAKVIEGMQAHGQRSQAGCHHLMEAIGRIHLSLQRACTAGKGRKEGGG